MVNDNSVRIFQIVAYKFMSLVQPRPEGFEIILHWSESVRAPSCQNAPMYNFDLIST
jgi:hypothetical protein